MATDLNSLADYIVKLNRTQNDDGSVVGPASSLMYDTTAVNVFTGTLSMGSELMAVEQQRLGDLRSFQEMFEASVRTYTQQAEFAKQDVAAILGQQRDKQLVDNTLGQMQDAGAMAEASHLGTGAMAIAQDAITTKYREQAQSIMAQSETDILDAWTKIDEEAVKLLTMSHEEYNTFMTQATAAEEDMWTWFIGTLKDDETYADLRDKETDEWLISDWREMLTEIGILERVESGYQYTEYGRLQIDQMLGSLDSDFKKYLNTDSKYKEFWDQNLRFMTRDMFGISEGMELPIFDADERAKYAQLSSYRTAAPGTEDRPSLEGLEGFELKEAMKKWDKAVDKVLGKEYRKKQGWFGHHSLSYKTANDLNIGGKAREALISGDLATGAVIIEDGKQWTYVGDGMFVTGGRDRVDIDITKPGKYTSETSYVVNTKTEGYQSVWSVVKAGDEEDRIKTLQKYYKYVIATTDGVTKYRGTNEWVGELDSITTDKSGKQVRRIK